MHAEQQATPDVETPAPLRMHVRPRPTTNAQTKPQPAFAVVLHNDPVNRFEWVVGVLKKVLRCGGPRAFWLVLRTHVTGRAVIWSGSREVAEFKVEQIHAAGADPAKMSSGAQPLSASIEAMPA